MAKRFEILPLTYSIQRGQMKVDGSELVWTKYALPSPICEKRISVSIYRGTGNDENVREKTRLTVSHARLFKSG